jgi:hypothetical protein
MMLRSSVYHPLAWCSLGYYFLSRCEPTGAILASMAAITIAWIAWKGALSPGRRASW